MGGSSNGAGREGEPEAVPLREVAKGLSPSIFHHRNRNGKAFRYGR